MDNYAKAKALVELGATVVPFQILPDGTKRPVGGFKWSEIKIDSEHANLVDTYWGYGRDPQPLVAWYHPTIGATDIDIDPKTGKNGYVTMERAGLELPETPVWYDTPRGGRHYIMRFPAGTTEAAPVTFNGVKLEGIDRRVANGLAIWYGDVPTAEELAQIPDAPEWMCEGKAATVDAPIVMDVVNARELLNAMPSGEIAPELKRILDTLVPGHIDHRAMLNAQYAIAAEGLRGHQGAPDALKELQGLYLAGKWNTAEYQEEWANGLKGLEAKVPEIMSKIKADAPTDEFEEAVQKEEFRLDVQHEAKKRFRQRTQGLPTRWSWTDLENVVLEWVLNSFFYNGSLNGLVGRSQIGKTFITVSMCASIALGVEWFGLKTDKKKVLYVAGEGKSGITKRFKDWCEHEGQKWEELQEQLAIVTDVDILNPMHVEYLQKLQEAEQFGLIVFDTLSATSSIENENDSAQMSEVMGNAKKVAAGTIAVFVHHPSEATKNMPNPKARGASAFYNDADNIATITVDRSFEPVADIPKYSNGDEPLFLTISTNFEDHGGKSKESEPITLKGFYLKEFKPGHIVLARTGGGFKDPDFEQFKAITFYLEMAKREITLESFWAAMESLKYEYKWASSSRSTANRLLKLSLARDWLEVKVEGKAHTKAVYQVPKLPNWDALKME